PLRRDIGRPHATAGIAPVAASALRAISPAMALLIVGAILVISAVIMVATEMWDTMAPGARLATVALPMALCYGAAAFVRSRGLTSERVAAVLALVGGCLAPFAAWIALGMTAPIEAFDRDLAMWIAVATAIGLVVQLATLAWLNNAVLTAPPSVSFVWLLAVLIEHTWPKSGSGAPVSSAIAVAGLALTIAGYAYARRGKPGHAIAPNIIGAVACLMGVTVLGAEVGSAWNVVAIVLPLVLILAASRAPFRPHLWAGAAFLVINIFRVGFSEFSETAGLPLTLLGCGLASLLTGYVVHRVRREYAG
ncbi:MAG: DUF2157 domain-containing protein, partial [Armatimonadetes bacterium]|nr:DUF2157 domain-containing protein [Armatimonadota bacterium]